MTRAPPCQVLAGRRVPTDDLRRCTWFRAIEAGPRQVRWDRPSPQAGRASRPSMVTDGARRHRRAVMRSARSGRPIDNRSWTNPRYGQGPEDGGFRNRFRGASPASLAHPHLDDAREVLRCWGGAEDLDRHRGGGRCFGGRFGRPCRGSRRGRWVMAGRRVVGRRDGDPLR